MNSHKMMHKSPNKFKKLSIFESKVLEAVQQVPKGKITTYKFLASAIRRPKAVRAVGNALHINPWAPSVPCHRVINSSGKIGGYGQGVKKKLEILKNEGIEFDANNQIKSIKNFIYKF